VRYAARVDDNQGEIVKALRKIGAVVTPIHRLGGGVSDLLVSFRQKWWVLEVKDGKKPPSERVLTPDEKRWIGEQKAPVYIVTSAAEAVQFLNDVAPDWLLGLEVRAMTARTHICEGPKPGADEPMAEEVKEDRRLLVDRVLEALRAAARSNQKMQSDQLCDQLGASKTSKRVEKALRTLCDQGLAVREGNNRRSLYSATQGST
jgi:hypothetical protein